PAPGPSRFLKAAEAARERKDHPERRLDDRVAPGERQAGAADVGAAERREVDLIEAGGRSHDELAAPQSLRCGRIDANRAWYDQHVGFLERSSRSSTRGHLDPCGQPGELG